MPARRKSHTFVSAGLPFRPGTSWATSTAKWRTGGAAVTAIFIDCNQQLGALWGRVHQPGDPAITVNTAPFSRDEVARVIGDHTIVIDDHSYLPTELVRRCANLRHIVFLGTGAASYMDVPALAELGIEVHIIKGYGDTAVAEHAVALMFASCRDIARMDRGIRGGVWRPREGVQLLGKTLGVVGVGGIGAEVARIAKGIGMEVIAWNRTQRPGTGLDFVDLDTLLARSDVVSLSLVLSDETRGFLDAARIARMKPGAILVNTARGALVDETALIDALQRGHIRHAGLDVFHDEPLKSDHLLAGMDNVTLSAHAAFRTVEASMTLLRRAIDIVKNIQN